MKISGLVFPLLFAVSALTFILLKNKEADLLEFLVTFSLGVFFALFLVQLANKIKKNNNVDE